MDSFKTFMNRLLQIAKLLYTPVSLFFISYFGWINRELLSRLVDVANLNFLIGAVCLWAALHLLSPVSTKIIFSSLGSTMTYTNLLNIYISRLPARYLPGGIWHTVGRLYDYRAFGISRKQVTILALIDTFFPCLITFFLGGGYLWFAGEKGILSSIEGIAALISCCTLLSIPFLVKWRLSSLWVNNFNFHYSLLILISLFFWMLASIAFLFYYSSVSFFIHQMPLPHVAATYIFSWGIGYISVFAPQGIGVFEFVAGALMELPMTLGGAVAFLAGFRIVAFTADGLVWLLYRFFKKFTGAFGHQENYK
jgi:glycosyltransferase 2 family protein